MFCIPRNILPPEEQIAVLSCSIMSQISLQYNKSLEYNKSMGFSNNLFPILIFRLRVKYNDGSLFSQTFKRD